MDIRQTLINVINTLELVNVSGKMNMDRLLGSIIMLERCAAEIEAQKEAQAAKQEAHADDA